MAWIKFEKDLLTDPRVLRIARSLQSRWLMFDASATPNNEQYDPCNAVALPAVTLVCGALVTLWSMADTHLGNDSQLPLGIDELDEVIGIPGFCALLPQDWLIPVNASIVKLPNFHKHNGTEAKKKAVTQKRVAKFRERNATALQPVTHIALPDQTRPDHTNTRPEKTKPDKSGKSKAFAPQAALSDVDPQIVADWLLVRETKKAAVTETAIKGIRVEAEKAGMSMQEVLKLCCERNWSGFKASWDRNDNPHGNGGNGKSTSKQAQLEAHNAAVAASVIARGPKGNQNEN
jgi:hypothetical protein